MPNYLTGAGPVPEPELPVSAVFAAVHLIAERNETPIHLCPPGSEARFPCCGRWVQETLSHRMTLDQDRVTCDGR